ncbi:FG-GAP-like repeat-containing protein [Muricoccus nepalensis]|nr:FG-GAP-like repeat-containing protein [Roseomonas nepalensis]
MISSLRRPLRAEPADAARDGLVETETEVGASPQGSWAEAGGGYLDGAATKPEAARAGAPAAAVAPGPASSLASNATLLSEVTFLTGLNPNGSRATGANSYWTTFGETAQKWGADGVGSPGGTLTYYFDLRSAFSATEKATFAKSFALWSAVANVSFTEVASGGAVRLQRGPYGDGAYADTAYRDGVGWATAHIDRGLISISTSETGFDLGGNPNTPIGGYGLSTVVHEVGHLLGLGHGGAYNGSVNPATQQFSQFDNRAWTVMSYIYSDGSNAGLKFGSTYPGAGIDWGTASDGYAREAPHTWMPLDVMAIQQLYGAAVGGPLSGGQVFGFNTNITGPLRDFFDFGYNRNPVVTVYDSGRNNALDLSGYSSAATLDLRDGHFSSFNGMTNNLAIAFGSVVETGIGGAGNDTIQGNAYNNVLVGGGGNDLIDGSAGYDVAVYAVSSNLVSWTRTPSGYAVTALGLGTDTLINIEALRFTDRDVLLRGARGDFDDDGHTDVLWRGQAGEVGMWQMSGPQIVVGGGVGSPGSYWTVAETGDFNGDGRADILWRGQAGEVGLWQMNGSQILAGGGVGNPGGYWGVAGTGDFNGDGRDDVLWRGQAGEVGMWQMNGSQIQAGGGVGNPGNDWKVAGTGDFNGDGRADILWRGQAGEVEIWQMNGLQIAGSGAVGNPGNYWIVAGTGDFNGDGRDDVLWRGQAGEVGMWQMNGPQIQAGGGLGSPGNYWKVAGTGDFNDDGRDDVLWRGQAGEVGMWQMNGLQILAGSGVSNPGTYWQIVG